jgi:hypothetical protein
MLSPLVPLLAAEGLLVSLRPNFWDPDWMSARICFCSFVETLAVLSVGAQIDMSWDCQAQIAVVTNGRDNDNKSLSTQ